MERMPLTIFAHPASRSSTRVRPILAASSSEGAVTYTTTASTDHLPVFAAACAYYIRPAHKDKLFTFSTPSTTRVSSEGRTKKKGRGIAPALLTSLSV